PGPAGRRKSPSACWTPRVERPSRWWSSILLSRQRLQVGSSHKLWYRPGGPLLVQPFAADRLMGQGHAAVRRGLEQAPLPLIPRLDSQGGGEKALAQGVEGQNVGGNALFAGEFVQGGLKIGCESDHHCRSPSVLASSGHDTGCARNVQAADAFQDDLSKSA